MLTAAKTIDLKCIIGLVYLNDVRKGLMSCIVGCCRHEN